MEIIAHRGASFLYGENTLKSIKKAMGMKADWIEMDIRITKDSHPVIIHDDSIDRTTNGQGKVKDINLAEIKQFDAGSGESIPHLKEVLTLVNAKIPLILDLKVPNSINIILNHLQDYDLEKIMIASFYHDQLLKIKEKKSELKTGVIFNCRPVKSHELALNCKCEYMFPHKNYVNSKMVDQAHQNQIKIYPWVIDYSYELKDLNTIGVDGIVTNKVGY